MSETDGPDSLPTGWAQVKLAALGALHCGQSPSVAEVNSKGIGTPYVTGPEQWDGQSIRMHKWTTAPKRLVPDGTIFITVKGAGVGTLFPGCACAIGRDIYAFEPGESIDRGFLVHGLRYNINEIIRKAQGDIPGLTKEHILDHEIPLPPVAEQRRIVAKLEALLAKVDASRKRLERIPIILKRFRQAVLAAACDGRLTEDWRGQKAVSIEDWRTTEIRNLLACPLGNGRSVPDAESGFPVLRLTAIRNGSIRLQERKIGAWSSADAQRFLVCTGDFLVARGNGSLALVGRGGLINEQPDPVAFPDTMIRIRVSPELMDPRFLRYAWDAKPVRDQIEVLAHTTAGIWKVSQRDLEGVFIPLPTKAEQEELVRRIESLFSLADLIEARYTKAKAQVDRLTQSILAKAFRGELVPQDPNDEPADVLLTRLTAAPAEASAPARRRGRPPRVQPAAPPAAPAVPRQ